MHDISCPHCGKAFKIDETGYADILKQVRDKDFEQQIHNRLELAEKEKLNAVELAKTFGGTDGHKYVNGVLDLLAQKLRAAETQAG